MNKADKKIILNAVKDSLNDYMLAKKCYEKKEISIDTYDKNKILYLNYKSLCSKLNLLNDFIDLENEIFLKTYNFTRELHNSYMLIVFMFKNCLNKTIEIKDFNVLKSVIDFSLESFNDDNRKKLNEYIDYISNNMEV